LARPVGYEIEGWVLPHGPQGDDPIAQLGPPPAARLWHERLAATGRLRLGTQDWTRLHISRLDRPVDIQASLRAVREDPR
jgi:hypothetical protein